MPFGLSSVPHILDMLYRLRLVETCLNIWLDIFDKNHNELIYI